MDYREQLKNPASLRYIDKLAQNVVDVPAEFSTAYSLIFDTDLNIAWRAAWLCQKISIKYPHWFTEKQFQELASLSVTTMHGGLQRGCLSILNNLEFPNAISVDFLNSCFDKMISPKSPIAVQALSMKILLRICIKEPDFIPELKAYLENIDYENYSAGFNSTRKNVLKVLNSK